MIHRGSGRGGRAAARRLEFGADDEAGFTKARERLLGDHRRWSARRGLTADVRAARHLVDLKWGHLDGHLGRWRVSDLHEILLSLFPRKVVLDAEHVPHILPAVGRFFEFLDEDGLLAPDGDPLPRLVSALEGLADRFVAGMSGQAGSGMAKSLVTAMTKEGVDLSDRAAVDAWFRDFNARSREDRERVLQGAGAALPPMAPPDDELAAQALAIPAMRQLAAFLAWIGDGRALTQKGHLRLADGKELVGLLGTGDRFDEAIGERTFKTHSTTDLPGVDLVYRLSLKARLARRQQGSVRRTRRGQRLADEPLRAYRDVVAAMVGLGLATGGREGWVGWWAGWLEGGAENLVRSLARAAEPVPLPIMSESAREWLEATYDLGSVPETSRAGLPESVAQTMGKIVDRLCWLGIATRDGVVAETDLWGHERRVGGQVALTALGLWYARPLLPAQGYEAPTPGELADAPAAELLEAIATWPRDAGLQALDLWRNGRLSAADELADAAREAATADRRSFALHVLEEFGEEAEPAVRELLEEPSLRTLAAVWLIKLGFDKPESFEPREDSPDATVQSLAVTLLSAGAPAVGEAFSAHADVDQQIAVLEHLWRVDDPYTEPVLEALAAAPNRQVAKAARKALFKHRTSRR